jgi:hypothetical protein
MSKANASAKNRRAYGGNPPPSPIPVPSSVPSSVPYQNTQPQQQGFTLQQVIAVIDSRLLTLEKFMNESNDGSSRRVQFEQTPPVAPSEQTLDISIQEVLSEFSNRFDMIVEEVTTLKDIVLKLQSYTMDVNKTLLEERINILSDLGTNNQVFNITSEIAESDSTIVDNITSEVTLNA